MARKAVLGVPVLVLVASWGFAAQPAVAAPDQPLAEVTVLPHARLAGDGAAVTASLRIVCEPNGVDGIQWEGFANAYQGDVFGYAELVLDCDGRPHVERVVIPVSAPPGAEVFTSGEATVSVFILDENTLTEYATDTRTVKVH